MAYTAQLYFDFSGYSDMAIGLGLMMGFRFMENFRQPYISQSVTEFWRRWHISLSAWLRDYLYISLGGNRNGTFGTYRNLFLTMLLGGLWHGANITFVIWGAWHGMWLAIERALHVGAAPRRFNPLKWAICFLLVLLGWVIFRAENLAVAIRMYQAMLGLDGWRLSELALIRIGGLQIMTLWVAYAIVAVCGLYDFYCRPLGARASGTGGGTNSGGALIVAGGMPGGTSLVWKRLLSRGALMAMFCLSVLKLLSQSYSPFLYFQF